MLKKIIRTSRKREYDLEKEKIEAPCKWIKDLKNTDNILNEGYAQEWDTDVVCTKNKQHHKMRWKVVCREEKKKRKHWRQDTQCRRHRQ